MALSSLERQVCDELASQAGELVDLASALIELDTTARAVGEPPRQEAQLQRLLAERLDTAGASIDLWEPDAAALAGMPMVPPGLSFEGRPQLIARFPGAGGGASLIYNGHIDVVSAEPRAAWTSDPFTATVRDGKLYGRGACDMKGGVAAMVFAAQTLARLGIGLRGELIVATNTDEESSGAGGTALVQRGLRADAAIVTEPTNFRTWVACRGSEYGVIHVPGRPGHAEVRQPGWRHGGAVNAIDKAAVVLNAIAALRADWETRREHTHPYLSPPSLLATMARAGEWPVTYPASCELTIAVMFLPIQADAVGGGAQVRQEVQERILAFCAAQDDWLAEHPPAFAWWPNPVMPMETSEHQPIVATLRAASADVGRPSALGGLDSWFDGATLTQLGGIPAVGYGPPGFDPSGVSVAHMVDEYVPVDGLIACAQGLAVTAMRHCGLA